MEYDQTQARIALQKAIEQTFEEMAFIDAELLPEPVSDDLDEDAYYSRISILKPFKAEITLKVPPGCAMLFAESLYANFEAVITDEIQRDVLAESLNTIAGCFMKNYLTDDEGYELCLPQTGIGLVQIDDNPRVKLEFDILGETLSASLFIAKD
ncbi:MAG: hypothetical protein H8E46_05100 [FCB group bacterium]|nr:hypothetical protein [FCB group bacterium]